MKKLRISFCIVVMLLAMMKVPASAQQLSERDQAFQLLQQMKEKYLHLNGVYMNMGYYYANEHTPGKYLDSVCGSLVMKGSNYKMNMQRVETTVNDRYSISLFTQDHLMYLSRPSSMQSFNPIAVVDSLFSGVEGTRYLIHTRDGLREAEIQFPGQQVYKSINFVVDTTTGYLLKTVLVLKTEYMTQGADAATLRQQGYDEYAVIETRLSGYRQEALPEDYFSEAQFFTRKDKEFQVTDAYRDYKIFVATPNL